MTGAAVHQACSSTVSRDLDLKAKETPHVVKFVPTPSPGRSARGVHLQASETNIIEGKDQSVFSKRAPRCHHVHFEGQVCHSPRLCWLFRRLSFTRAREQKKSVNCSIHLPTHTRNKDTNELMFSWFPIFFPIDVPIDMRSEDPRIPNEIIVRVWRCVSSSAVWYEWQCECGGQSTRGVQRKRQELQGWTLLMSGYKENQAQAAQMCAERKLVMIESASTFAKPGDENSYKQKDFK